ncbi:MAG TPA: peptidyl-alpha-hydroxyglycine alpha-amidating lyase family protein [Candidatus Elarobacter sp.]|jgi:DNA-binding beta-propeller fold protein YncE|nr:peptidyl-alpha-hydroxyglycine alpha-amidating lyase family protein [Candidatus Elarobacter sp.]
MDSSTTTGRDGDDAQIVFGSGRFRYRLVNDWARLPAGWTLDDVASVAVDDRDRVYVFTRGEHPVIVFDRDGTLLDHWGEGVFDRPHAIHAAPDGLLYCVDDGDHTVRTCTQGGAVLATLGTPGAPKPFMSGEPFCRCTDVALSPSGEIFVSDGYGNARVHKFAPDGTLLRSWGAPGNDPGEFNFPHNICCDDDGWVYVADRENHRIQIFDGNGRFETQWVNMHRVSALEQERGPERNFYLGEIGPHLRANRDFPNCGPRVTIMSPQGTVLARLGDLPAGDAPDRFISPHGIAIDSRGDIYVGEVSYTSWPGAFREPAPARLRTLRKLVRVNES